MASTTHVTLSRRHDAGHQADSDSLADALRQEISGEVRFDDGSRALYAADASNYRQVPIGVVLPRTRDDVLGTVELCRRFDVPVLSRGGGTSLAGQCCNTAVVMDMSKYYNRLLSLDPEQRVARVQPGIVLDRLRNAAERHHLTFGPDPATHNHCTLGGMLGNNSCGVHSVVAGRTVDNVRALDVVTYDGRRMSVGATSPAELDRLVAGGDGDGVARTYAQLVDLRDRYADEIRRRFPKIPRLVSGYALDQLLPENQFHVGRALVGSEGTCVTILEATLDLIDSPPHKVLAVLGFHDVFAAADCVPQILELEPRGLEGIDERLVQNMHRKHMHQEALQTLPEGRAWLIVEFGGRSPSEAESAAKRLISKLDSVANGTVFTDPDHQAKVWEVRESGLGATAFVPGEHDAWPGWEDSAVPPDRYGDYMRDFRSLLDRFGYECALYGHFGDGCLHVRIDFDLESEPGIEQYRAFAESAADLVSSYGGSYSGEHGDGQSRAELLPKMFGPELVHAFEEFKGIWDPDNRMNPGKVVHPYRMDENLRLGPGYAPEEPATHFSYAREGGFARSTLHCVGVGKCRRDEGGTMCPSFMVTHEEKHSTRGRAHLLFEMLRGELVRGGWRDRNVFDALHLCLSCKGCKSDCPVNVDMATYKAEFLSHYYQRRVRPRAAYAFGMIFIWARMASKVPRLANFLAHAPGSSRIVKFLAGVAPQRSVPKLADSTFRQQFRAGPSGGTEVLLWVDTFNEHFHPEIAQAAVRVLERCGFHVSIPDAHLCCGRPLYDFGMLRLAKHELRRVLDHLREPVRRGLPVVVLEPSCLAVFRDEMVNLFPHDHDAQRLAAQACSLAELLAKYDVDLPHMEAEAIVQAHCHQASIVGMEPDLAVLERVGVRRQMLDTGCCGMAGSFGFEAGDRYEVSVACAERALAPQVRESSPDTLVMADGFSCREQIRQLTNRRALHIAEVLDMASSHSTEKEVAHALASAE